MKYLFLLRHAKSNSFQTDLSDIDRALTDGGRRAAQLVGSYIDSQRLWPDLVISSPAVRARETTELVLASASAHIDVEYDPQVYEATPQILLDIIARVDKKREVLLLVGHNPGLEDLLRLLTGRAELMSTASLAKISLDISDWSQSDVSKGTFDWILTPSERSKPILKY